MVETLCDVLIELRQMLDIKVFKSSGGHREGKGLGFESL